MNIVVRRAVLYRVCVHRFAVTRKLSGGHRAADMCLAVGKLSAHEDIAVTGSKVHYIKTKSLLCTTVLVLVGSQ